MSVVKLVKVYFNYPEYMKPKEVTKVFRLHRKFVTAYKKDSSSSETAEVKAELLLLLDVITAAENLTYKVAAWTDPDGEEVTVFQILEIISESMFDKGQDD